MVAPGGPPRQDEKALLTFAYLLGKMDGLRYPPHAINYNGEPLLAYNKQYIEELLTLRSHLSFPSPKET